MMKKIVYIGLLISCIFIAASCSDKDDEITPKDISNITTEALPGKIHLKWDIPDDSNILYVKVTYFDHWTQETHVKLISTFSDGIIIDELLNKFGDYTFEIQPISSTETEGKVQTISATCQPRPAEYKAIDRELITLTPDMVTCLFADPSEGKIEDMLDDNLSTYFHTNWHDEMEMPHYIDIELKNPIRGFQLAYSTRDRTNTSHPAEIKIYASNDPDNFGTEVFSQNSGLPTGASADYTSQALTLSDECKYIRFSVERSSDNSKFFTIAELKIYKSIMSIYDPEKE